MAPIATARGMSDRSLAVSAGDDSRAAGTATPARIGSSRHERPRFGRRRRRPVTRSSAAPSARKIGSPIRTSAAIRRYETCAADASPAATLAPATRSTNGRPASSSTEPPARSPNRIFGPARSVRMASGRWPAAAARRTASAAAACEAGVPCEKLIRATSIPAAASVSIRRAVAGPIVQISFVRRRASVSPEPSSSSDSIEHRAVSLSGAAPRERFHDSFMQIPVDLARWSIYRRERKRGAVS